MKSVKANLLGDVVSIYDQTKTTIQGRVAQKVIDSKPVLGPVLNKFIDVFTDTAGTAVPVINYSTASGRVFTLSAEAGGNSILSLHTYNFATGDVAYIGCIRVSLPDIAATTHTLRSLKVIDTGSTGWKIFITTSASILINGGTFCANNIDLIDFSPLAFPTIPFATGLNQKAVYFLQDPLNIGVGQLQTISVGSVLDQNNNRIYVHNGAAATHQYYVYDTSASLNCPLTTGVTIDAGTDRLTQTAHGYADNTPIFLTNLSGGTGLTNNTTYFVRNPTVNDYQVSATTGGAAINITINGSVDVCRAFGTSGSAFVHKTGNLPALSGTLLATDSEDFATPQHTTNAGFSCVFFSTSSNLYLGRLSELTPGATSWASLVTSNLLGVPNQIIAPSAAIATWSNALDRAIYTTNTNLFVVKRIVNNEIDTIFGGTGNFYLEGKPSNVIVEQKPITISSIDLEQGVLFTVGSAVGQRGLLTTDMLADSNYNNTFIISKVLDIPNGILEFVDTFEELWAYSGVVKLEYRTSGFGSSTGGWLLLPEKESLTSVSVATGQIQFRISFKIIQDGGGIPAQVNDLFVGLTSNNEVSDNWEFSNDDSDNGNPSRAAFRLKKAYSGSVPTLFFRAYDLSDSLIVNHNTVSQASNFQYSTDGGVNWNNVGTVPNTVGTLIRYTFSVSPGVDVRPSLRES
jgi:hypothetical protein